MRHAIARSTTTGTRRAGLFLFAFLALALGGGCGGDTPPTAPAPAPAPPPPPPPPAPEPEPPAVPTGLRVSASGMDFIEWSWTPVAGVSGYDVQYSANEAFTDQDDIIARTAEQISYRREGLAAGTSAYLRVRSVFETGSERITSPWSTHVTGMTGPSEPPVPGGSADTATFREGDRIPEFPSGNAAAGANTSGSVSISVNRGRVTITMGRGGAVEYSDYRYTCNASSCRIEDGVVTAGEIERTATGGGGGTSNRAPRAVGSIPDQTLTEDGSATTVNVSERFSDPDGDSLSYQATSSRTSVVRASVSGSRVTLTPGNAGTAHITVTASDPAGLSATQRFSVTVEPEASDGATTFQVGDRIPGFPSGSAAAGATTSGSVSISVNRGRVTITMGRDGSVEYTDYRYTCIASSCRIEDGVVTAGEIERTAAGGGGTSNRAPRAAGSIPDQTLTEDGSATTVNVSARFTDPDGDRLSYQATSSRTSVVRVSVSGSRVTLTPRDAGTATVTVTATDPGGLNATQRFAATVEAAATGSGVCRNSRATPSGSSAALVRDCGILLEARDQLRGTARLNWSADRAIGSWDGVVSSPDGVTALYLWENDLTGTIPDSLGNLANLETLQLDGNTLTGSIPDSLGNLANLVELAVAGNTLTGSIPDSLGNLANLRRLSLGGNTLTGSIPDSLGNLANLRELLLAFNGITGDGLTGVIPDSLGNLANLENLSLGSNNLTGTIPDSLGNLTNLRELRLYANDLTGAIPDSLGNLANLRLLSLGGKLDGTARLSGEIPDSLGNLANLENLSLGSNNLTGTIPDSLGNLANLETLQLGSGSLTGSIPDSLGNLANLGWLFLALNDLTGAIPDSLGNLANLRGLILYENDLTGAIPNSLGNLTNLERLSLYRNNLTGCIPERLAAFVSSINPQQGGVQLAVCGAGNRAPRAVGSIPDQTLTEDGSATTVNVSARFSDPDGDRLSYRATSSRTSVVEASVSGSRVTLTPRNAGTATVTVTATDPGGLSATQRLTVTVTRSGGDSAACRAGAVYGPGDSCTHDGATFTVRSGGCFSLSTAGTGNFCTANFSFGGWRITRVGASSFRIDALPGSGTSNRASRTVGSTSDQTLTEDGNATTIDASARFSDPDGDRLSYRTTSRPTTVMRVSVSGSRLTLTPGDTGAAHITVTVARPSDPAVPTRGSET